jgi:hypothetical protein
MPERSTSPTEIADDLSRGEDGGFRLVLTRWPRMTDFWVRAACFFGGAFPLILPATFLFFAEALVKRGITFPLGFIGGDDFP